MACTQLRGFFYLMVAFAFLLLRQSSQATAVNDRPVIGVLAQAFHNKNNEEYVMSEYIKFLEMAGASVVVVKGKQPDEYYHKLFKQINGVLIPGGGVSITKSPYSRSSRILYDLAIEANDNGDYFPIWATCLGFEELTFLTSKEYLLSPCDAQNLPLPLDLESSYNDSRMLGSAPKDVIDILKKEKVTANFHKYCIKTETFKQHQSLKKFYNILSTNKDRKGVEFVSTIEAFKYPIYGVQWHPEKNPFTRRADKDIPHTANAIQIRQYFANFFVNQARKNLHKFDSEDERAQAVVENDYRVFDPKNYIENFYYNVTNCTNGH